MIDIVRGPFSLLADTATPGSPWALVAGGYGVAPLLGLAENLRRSDPSRAIHLFYGARSADDLLLTEQFTEVGVEMHLFTQDGSRGQKGIVTDGLFPFADQAAGQLAIAACGPNGMLEAVGRFAVAKDIACEVSLEAPMACGFGICFGCAYDDDWGRHRLLCVDGPVIDAKDVYKPGGR